MIKTSHVLKDECYKKVEFYSSISKVQLNSSDENIILNYIRNNDLTNIFIPILQHRIQYLLFKHLFDLKITNEVNRSILKILNMQFSFLQLKHEEWTNVLNLFVNNLNYYNINYAILKGIELTNDLYTVRGLKYRDYNDIDILIEKKDVQILKNILEEMGFIQGNLNENYEIEKADRKQILEFSLNSHQEKSYIKFSKYSTFSPLNRLIIDVNTTIFEGGKVTPKIECEKILCNTINKKVDNITYRALCPEYNLIQICYHFYKDTVYDIKKQLNESYCLIKFCDIREYILKFYTKIDWDIFVSLVNENNIANEIYFVLDLILCFYNDINIRWVIKKFNINRNNLKQFNFNFL